MFYTGFRTAIGMVHVVWGAVSVSGKPGVKEGLLSVSFSDVSERFFLKKAKERFGVVPVEGQNPPGGVKRLLERYFAGEEVSFSDVPLDLTFGTPFQQDVWRKLMTVPYGEVRSYGWVAREVGRPGAVRAVGRACGQNPLPPIIPCHRVVGSRGELTGYSGRGGISLKKRLLELERVKIASVGAGFKPAPTKISVLHC